MSIEFVDSPPDTIWQLSESEELAHVANQINNQPCKCLGMKTPNQALFGIDPPVALRG